MTRIPTWTPPCYPSLVEMQHLKLSPALTLEDNYCSHHCLKEPTRLHWSYLWIWKNILWEITGYKGHWVPRYATAKYLLVVFVLQSCSLILEQRSIVEHAASFCLTSYCNLPVGPKSWTGDLKWDSLHDQMFKVSVVQTLQGEPKLISFILRHCNNQLTSRLK